MKSRFVAEEAVYLCVVIIQGVAVGTFHEYISKRLAERALIIFSTFSQLLKILLHSFCNFVSRACRPIMQTFLSHRFP